MLLAALCKTFVRTWAMKSGILQHCVSSLASQCPDERASLYTCSCAAAGGYPQPGMYPQQGGMMGGGGGMMGGGRRKGGFGGGAGLLAGGGAGKLPFQASLAMPECGLMTQCSS